MKVEIKENEIKYFYPMIMKHKTEHYFVLATCRLNDDFRGIVLEGKKYGGLGFSGTYPLDSFERFTGEITLSND